MAEILRDKGMHKVHCTLRKYNASLHCVLWYLSSVWRDFSHILEVQLIDFEVQVHVFSVLADYLQLMS